MTRYIYRRCNIDDVVPGTELGKMVVTSDGVNYLSEGAVLTLLVIQRLKSRGFRFVEIRELAKEPSDLMVAAEAAMGSTAISSDEEGDEETPDLPLEFCASYNNAVMALKKCMTNVRFLQEGFDADEILSTVETHIFPLLEEPNILDYLQIVRHHEDYLYHHSVGVGVIAGLLGGWLGRSFGEVKDLVIGGLLHDTGKALIPLKVVNKPALLTEAIVLTGNVKSSNLP